MLLLLFDAHHMMSSFKENYDLDDISGDESEGYSPVAKKTVSSTCYLWLSLISHHQSKAASKAPAKPKPKPPAKPKSRNLHQRGP